MFFPREPSPALSRLPGKPVPAVRKVAANECRDENSTDTLIHNAGKLKTSMKLRVWLKTG